MGNSCFFFSISFFHTKAKISNKLYVHKVFQKKKEKKITLIVALKPAYTFLLNMNIKVCTSSKLVSDFKMRIKQAQMERVCCRTGNDANNVYYKLHNS